MKKYKKLTGFLFATSLLSFPTSSLINSYDNVAKAENKEDIKEINFKNDNLFKETNDIIKKYRENKININSNIKPMYDGWAGSNGVIATDYLDTKQCVEYITNTTVSNYSSAAGFLSYLFTGAKAIGISIITALLPTYHSELWYKCKEAASEGKGVLIRYVGVKTWDGHGTLKYPIYSIM